MGRPPGGSRRGTRWIRWHSTGAVYGTEGRRLDVACACRPGHIFVHRELDPRQLARLLVESRPRTQRNHGIVCVVCRVDCVVLSDERRADRTCGTCTVASLRRRSATSAYYIQATAVGAQARAASCETWSSPRWRRLSQFR
eukprot:166736-Prymnesium_polylepis.1